MRKIEIIIKRRNIFRDYEDGYSVSITKDENEYDNEYYERIINENNKGDEYYGI